MHQYHYEALLRCSLIIKSNFFLNSSNFEVTNHYNVLVVTLRKDKINIFFRSQFLFAMIMWFLPWSCHKGNFIIYHYICKFLKFLFEPKGFGIFYLECNFRLPDLISTHVRYASLVGKQANSISKTFEPMTDKKTAYCWIEPWQMSMNATQSTVRTKQKQKQLSITYDFMKPV